MYEFMNKINMVLVKLMIFFFFIFNSQRFKCIHVIMTVWTHVCRPFSLPSLVTWFYASRCNDLWVGKTRRVDNVSGLKPRAVSAVCRWRMLWFNVERSSFAACWFCVYVVSVCLWMWIWFPFEIFNVFFTSGCLKNMEMSLSGSLQCNCWLVCIDPAK